MVEEGEVVFGHGFVQEEIERLSKSRSGGEEQNRHSYPKIKIWEYEERERLTGKEKRSDRKIIGKNKKIIKKLLIEIRLRTLESFKVTIGKQEKQIKVIAQPKCYNWTQK